MQSSNLSRCFRKELKIIGGRRMKVKATITGSDLTEGIRFYGDTHYDNETIEQLKQLAMVLEDVVTDLEYVERQVKGRHEGSAKQIKCQLDTMRNDLLWVSFGEE